MTVPGPEPVHSSIPGAHSGEDVLDPLRVLVERLERLISSPHAPATAPDKSWHLQVKALLEELSLQTSNVRDLLEPARTLRENRLLREVGRRLGQELSTEGLALLIMDTLGGVVDFDAAGIYFMDPRDGTIRWESLRGYDTDKLHLVRQKLDRGIMAWILKHGRSVIVPDVREDPRYFNARDRTLSELVVPILHEGRMIGFFNLESDRVGTYGEQERLLMEVLASQVAQTVEYMLLRADRLERRRVVADLQVARNIQRSLLPKQGLLLHDIEVAGLNLPSAEVGGDYFDHFLITPQDVGLVIADVAGKGIPASLIMASVRTGIRILAQHRLDMTGIMGHLNEHLLEVTDSDSFVTVCYGVYHRPSRRLSYVNAGHNPPLLMRARSHAIESLDSGGLILGAFRGVTYEMGIVDLEPGDRLLFYTDGLNEALDRQGNEFGMGEVRRTLSESRWLDAASLIQAQLASLRRHTGAGERAVRFQDDLTLMALVCREENQE
jgi:sigma-B regulation protein RsbU (phosphoserine phosphatase)